MTVARVRTLTVSVLCTVLFPLAGFCQNQVSESGKAGMSFLSMPPSARIAALGGEGFALDEGSSSQWSNPASIASSESNAADFTHTVWIEGITSDYASIMLAGSRNTLGASVQILDSGNIDGRDQFGGSTGNYDITNTGLSLSYARKIGTIRAGVAVRKLFQKIADETAGGYGLDAGIMADTPVDGLTIGAVARNYGKMNKLLDEETKLPSNIGIGMSYQGILPVYARPYTLIADYLLPTYGENGAHLGLEIAASDIFQIRIGYRSDSYFETMSYGIGMVWQKVKADLSYSPLNNISDDAFRFTLSVAGF
jgi:hypothetical protein